MDWRSLIIGRKKFQRWLRSLTLSIEELLGNHARPILDHEVNIQVSSVGILKPCLNDRVLG